MQASKRPAGCLAVDDNIGKGKTLWLAWAMLYTFACKVRCAWLFGCADFVWTAKVYVKNARL